MPRPIQPYWRTHTKSWYVAINGQQIPLGKDEKQAFGKFYDLMGHRDDIRADVATVYELPQSFLDWSLKNRKPGTYLKHRMHLQGFIESISKRLKVGEI